MSARVRDIVFFAAAVAAILGFVWTVIAYFIPPEPSSCLDSSFLNDSTMADLAPLLTSFSRLLLS